MKTYTKTKEEALKDRKWYIVDAEGVTLGRLASEVASLLRGKDKPTFTPHVDGGDHVVVINAEKVRLTGKKREQKKYYRHTGYVGGIKEISVEDVLSSDHPERVVFKAVKGMVPRGALGHQIIKKLKVYAGEEHPHSAQGPEKYEFKYVSAV